MDINATGSSTTPPSYTSGPMTRDQKTYEYIGKVAPTAIQVGMKELQIARASQGAASSSAAAGSVAEGAGWLGTAGAWLGYAGAALGAYQIVTDWGRSTPAAGATSGAAVGAAVGTFITPGLGTAIGAAFGALAGGLLGSIHTGKHKDQIVRDNVRDFLVQNGVLDESYHLTLAGGVTYDMGVDGGPKAELNGRRPYEIDFQNPLSKYAISWVNPLVALFARGNEKVKTDFVGYFANAALSNAKTLADVRANVDAIVAKFGLTNEKLADTITYGAKTGALNADIAAAYLNGIKERSDPNFSGELAPVTK